MKRSKGRSCSLIPESPADSFSSIMFSRPGFRHSRTSMRSEHVPSGLRLQRLVYVDKLPSNLWRLAEHPTIDFLHWCFHIHSYIMHKYDRKQYACNYICLYIFLTCCPVVNSNLEHILTFYLRYGRIWLFEKDCSTPLIIQPRQNNMDVVNLCCPLSG